MKNTNRSVESIHPMMEEKLRNVQKQQYHAINYNDYTRWDTTRKQEEDMTLKITVPRIARVCHEVNRAACEAFGDFSQPTWENAPDWQRYSSVNGVRFVLANPGTLPAESHSNWLAEKMADGWTYGPVKDVENKKHPCFLPYSKLPPEQRLKDYLFNAVIFALTDPEGKLQSDADLMAQVVDDVENEAVEEAIEEARVRVEAETVEEALEVATSDPKPVDYTQETDPHPVEPTVNDQTWAKDAMQVEENNQASLATIGDLPEAPSDTEQS